MSRALAILGAVAVLAIALVDVFRKRPPGPPGVSAKAVRFAACGGWM